MNSSGDMRYDRDYFIAFFGAIPAENWVIGHWGFGGSGCILTHLAGNSVRARECLSDGVFSARSKAFLNIISRSKYRAEFPYLGSNNLDVLAAFAVWINDSLCNGRFPSPRDAVLGVLAELPLEPGPIISVDVREYYAARKQSWGPGIMPETSFKWNPLPPVWINSPSIPKDYAPKPFFY